VIYLDTSVALAHLLAEDRRPPDTLWEEPLVASRLLAYELWTRVHARKLTDSHGDAVVELLGRVALVEMVAPVLGRVTEPFPIAVRTLDALHLATMDFFVRQGARLSLATYDERLRDAALALSIPLAAV
jgi:predicted nucleic acid-binding protein